MTILQFLAKFAAKKAGKEVQRDAAGGDDPFAIDKPALSFLDPIKGLNGAEAAADEVVSKLQEAGVDPKKINYGKIVGDIEKGVLKDEIPLDKVKDSVFEAERTRINLETTDPAPSVEPPTPDAKKQPSPEKPTPPSKDQGSEGTDPGLSGASTDADEDLENASPENKKFMDDLMKPGGVEDILMKKPQDMTEDEVRQIMVARTDAKTEDERQQLFKAEKGFFDHFFGSEPAPPDAAGRTMEPKPIRPIPEKPAVPSAGDGQPLKLSLKRIGSNVLLDAKGNGLTSAVKRLQGGINLLGSAAPQLKEDGDFGPKTRTGLRQAAAKLGAPNVEEGLALGRFNDFVKSGGKEGFGGLAKETEKNFSTLFRDPVKSARRPEDRAEVVTLQETLNDLGGKEIEPLKLDGDIGPKTTDAFSQLAATLGPERLTKKFGEFLGFI
ncbi:MAG: hypothetical protein HQ512_07710 [Rhodospirillales bacterium]|nr:hypothetical protein [Rhodospirillales bacterium]